MEMTETACGLLIPTEKPKPIEFDWDEYYERHSCCPRCGTTDFCVTTMGTMGNEDHNRVNCRCGWNGTVNELVRADAWRDFEHARPDMPGFYWVRRSNEIVDLAYWACSPCRFQWADTVGDREGLNVDYFDDVTHWADIPTKKFPS